MKNKQDIVSALLSEFDMIQKNELMRIVDRFLEEVQHQVCTDGCVRLSGFGSFKRRTRKARQGRNPKTGRVLRLPSVEEVQFSAAQLFKRKLN